MFWLFNKVSRRLSHNQQLIFCIANVNWTSQNYQVQPNMSLMSCRKVKNDVVARNEYKYYSSTAFTLPKSLAWI